MSSTQRWIPAGLLAAGCLLNLGISARRAGPVPLRGPIAGVAPTLLGAVGADVQVSDDVRRIAGMSSYMFRNYQPAGQAGFSVYVGYYDEQRQGKSIHSPKNCLPGDGWESVEADTATIETLAGPAVVNRYRVAKAGGQALVYYWYQGRGRIAHDEFKVKFELLRDAALYGRTEEALVRIVVPVADTAVGAADREARQIAPTLVRDLNRILPAM
jgi:EpsI family protein